MKKQLIALAMAFTFILTGCAGGNGSDENKGGADTPKTQISVFAAASMTETLTEIEKLYEEQNKNIDIIYTFDSSGTLLTQIQEGAKADLFISAAQKQINALDKEKAEKPDELKVFIDSATRTDLLENVVVLAVPSDNPKNISSFDDINTEKVEKIALGNGDVPVGQYSEEILKNMGVWDAIQPKITFGSNVKEVTTWVGENAADCGIIYSTDAYSAGLKAVAKAPEGTLKTPVIYPAAVLDNSENKDEVKKFLEFLKSDEAKKIFESVGFKVL